MVIEDLGGRSVVKSNDKMWSIVSPMDRFLAFVLDLLILSPIVGLFSAVYLRDLRFYELYSGDATEVSVTVILFIFISILAASVMQTLFLYFWQATPGQRFLYLKVASYQDPNRTKLSFGQALSRSFSWWFGAIFFFLPNLEILSHPLRRAYHDRISDTVVIDLKGKNSRPLKSEAHFLSRWLYLFFTGYIGIIFLIVVKMQEQTLEGSFTFSHQLKDGLLCDAVDKLEMNYQKRLDLALAMYLTESASAICLQKEADFVLWQRQAKYYPLAYLAKALLTDKQTDQDFYEKKICQDHGETVSEECSVVKFLKSEDEDRADQLRKTGLKLTSSRVLLLQESMVVKRFESSLALIDDLAKEPSLEAAMNRYYVRVVWDLKETDQVVNSRKPASESNNKTDSTFKSNAIKTFKERFEIE